MQAFEGLSEADAARRLVEVGANELPRPRRRDIGRIVFETLREPMFLLLLAAAGLYLGLGDTLEGIFLLAGASAAVGLVVFQEARSERALAALRDLAQPTARIVRGGVERSAPARELVPDDIVLIGEGERMVADAVLVGGDVLSVDESTLTGESAPVAKRLARAGEKEDYALASRPEASPHLFAGTLIVRGIGGSGHFPTFCASAQALGMRWDDCASIFPTCTRSICMTLPDANCSPARIAL